MGTRPPLRGLGGASVRLLGAGPWTPGRAVTSGSEMSPHREGPGELGRFGPSEGPPSSTARDGEGGGVTRPGRCSAGSFPRPGPAPASASWPVQRARRPSWEGASARPGRPPSPSEAAGHCPQMNPDPDRPRAGTMSRRYTPCLPSLTGEPWARPVSPWPPPRPPSRESSLDGRTDGRTDGWLSSVMANL